MNRPTPPISGIILLFVVMAMLASCDSLRGPVIATSDDGEIQATLELSRGQYELGETVEVAFTLMNISDQVVILERSDGVVQDIIVPIDGVEHRWTTESGQVEAFHRLSLAPGEVSTIHWSLADLEVGDYGFAGVWWSGNRREATVVAGAAYGPIHR